MTWQFSPQRPVSEQLTDRMIHSIVSGELSSEKSIPDFQQFSLEIAVNPNTVRRVFDQLIEQGLLIRKEDGKLYPSNDAALLQSFRRSMALSAVQNFLSSMRELSYTPDEAAEMIREVIL